MPECVLRRPRVLQNSQDSSGARLRRHTEVKTEPQSGIPKEKAIEVLMEITSLATMVTMNYAKRKHLSASRDKTEPECSIKITKQQLDMSPLQRHKS